MYDRTAGRVADLSKIGQPRVLFYEHTNPDGSKEHHQHVCVMSMGPEIVEAIAKRAAELVLAGLVAIDAVDAPKS